MQRRVILAARDGKRCYYCGKLFSVNKLTLEHKIPIIRGGTDDFGNLVLACKTCNDQKGPMTEQEFKKYGPIGGRFLILRNRKSMNQSANHANRKNGCPTIRQETTVRVV